MRFLSLEQASFPCGRNTFIPSAKKARHNRWNTLSAWKSNYLLPLKKPFSSSAANLHLKCVVLASLFIWWCCSSGQNRRVTF